MQLSQETLHVLANIRKYGGRPLIVGGAVRDYLLGVPCKDLDVEVYGVSLAAVHEALGPSANECGREFGILRLCVGDWEMDFSQPRKDSRVGVGHKGFKAEFDPNMTLQDAAMRRDFTVNSMAYDPETGELFDFFDGQADLRNKILRMTDPVVFKDDPVRVMRGVMMCGRCDLVAHPDTIRRCAEVLPSYHDMTKERIWMELWKWAAKSAVPSRGLDFLYQTGWLVHFTELLSLLECDQDPIWHPEGNVWKHTKHVCDAAAGIAVREKLSEQDRGELVLAALLHDIGKPSTSTNESGKIVSPGHEGIGATLAENFLSDLGAPYDVIKRVALLVREHMAHVHMGPNPNDRAIRRLARRLDPVSIKTLSRLVEADHSGRPPLPVGNPLEFIQSRAVELAVQDSAPKPILMGRHLLLLGVAAGPQMGQILSAAFEAQLDGAFSDLEGALDWWRAR